MGVSADAECAGETARSSGKLVILHAGTPGSHEIETGNGFQCPEEDEPGAFPTLHEDIEEPVHAVVHVNVGIAGGVALHEGPSARAKPRVTGGVVHGIIGFGFHDAADAAVQDEMAADQAFRASDRILHEKILENRLHGPDASAETRGSQARA